MKMNEIAGTGNWNTAEFWEYQTRTGHRENPDPKPNPSLSPYAVFGSNPIMFNDVNGDSIRMEIMDKSLNSGSGGLIHLTYRETEKGGFGFYKENGGKYDGDDELVSQVNGALGRLSLGSEGKSLVTRLMSHKKDIFIRRGRINTTDVANGDIGWNPNSRSGGFNQNGNRRVLPWVSLGHELGHAYSVLFNVKLPSGLWTPDVPWDDINASHWENKIRGENGIPLRTHYATSEDQKTGTYSPDPNTPLLRNGTSQSLYLDVNQNVYYQGIPKGTIPYDYRK